MILLRNGRVIDPKSGFDEICDVLIQDGYIRKIEKNMYRDNGRDARVIDCSGKIIAPGLVDVHVHFRDPGFTYKEDIESGSNAAKRGGYTSVVLMANTRPPVDNSDVLQYVLDKGKKTGIHVYSCATVTEHMEGSVLTDFSALKKNGAIGFTDDGKPLMNRELVRKAMLLAAKEDTVLSFHEEDPFYIKNNGIHSGTAADYYHIEGSDRQAEISMVKRDLILAEETHAKVNFQHISARESVELIRQAKNNGMGFIHAEATPHHIALTQDAAIKYGTLAKMNPPLREEEDRAAIIQGLLDGTIDIIATDHAPHSTEEKKKPITEAPSGILGLETAFSIAYRTLVMENNMPLLTLFARMSLQPAEMYGLNAGFLAENGPADICIIDPESIYTIDTFASKSQNSPFSGEKLTGRIVMTICNGEIVYGR